MGFYNYKVGNQMYLMNEPMKILKELLWVKIPVKVYISLTITEVYKI